MEGRRTRTRTSTAGGTTPTNEKSDARQANKTCSTAPSTPAGSQLEEEPPASDLSDGVRGSRSSRLSNPEFAAKHKAFMAKVTAATKGSMDNYLTNEIISETTPAPGKRKIHMKTDDQQSKRRRSARTNSSVDSINDSYCWICHKEGDFICCDTCPRVFHAKCIQLDSRPAEDWVCPECVLVMSADNMNTRSRAMRLLTIDQLCTLLKHAINRMKSVSNVEPFLKPVDPLQFPAYKDYVSCPMDLQSMERNIRKKQYGSTEAMLADCKWILHNCIIFNSSSSKLTNIAKNIVNVCKHEMQEIENCPDCYLNAHIKKDVWFTEACRLPHALVWAKLKGFPYWPGKLMRACETQGDVRFFGAHDRAWIPMKDIFLYSEKPPIEIKKKRGNIEGSYEEVEKHRMKLEDRFGKVEYAEHKTAYDITKELEMLQIILPNYSPPFDIGLLVRRSRTFSYSGSEKSRDATPTPSEELSEDLTEEYAIQADTKIGERENAKLENSKIMPIKVKINTKLAIVSSPVSEQPNHIKKTLKTDTKQSVSTLAVRNENDISMIREDKTEVIATKPADNQENHDAELEEKEDVEENFSSAQDEVDSQLQKFVSDPQDAVNQTETIYKINSPGPSVTQKETTHSDLVFSNNESVANTRTTISPPCEVTSTTLVLPSTESAAIQTKSTEKVVESDRILADSNDEKIILEGEEVEKDENLAFTETPSETNDSDNQLSNIQPSCTTTEKDIAQQEKTGTETNNAKKPIDCLGLSVSLTVIKKPNGETSEKNSNSSSIEEEEGKQVQNKSYHDKNSESLGEKRKRSDISDKTESSEAELTISKVKRVSKESSGGLSGTTEPISQHSRRPSQNVSPVATNSVQPPFLPRYPGIRPGMHTIGPMMPMMGPAGGMLVRGLPPPFRGARPMPSRMLQPPGPLSLPPNLPSAAGPVADQLNKVANKLAESLKGHFLDSLSDINIIEEESPSSTIEKIKVEIERAEWRHQQELAELKRNADVVILEMRQAMEAEKQKALNDCKKQAEIEKQAAIKEMKKKQWCSHCGKEAIFYCCWNTSYCDYPCQQSHWPSHMTSCAQNTAKDEEAVLPDPISMQQQFLQQQQQQQLAVAAANRRHNMMMVPGGGMAGMRFMRPPRRMGPIPGYPRPYFL